MGIFAHEKTPRLLDLGDGIRRPSGELPLRQVPLTLRNTPGGPARAGGRSRRADGDGRRSCP